MLSLKRETIWINPGGIRMVDEKYLSEFARRQEEGILKKRLAGLYL